METVAGDSVHPLLWKGKPLPILDVSRIWEACHRAGIRAEGHFPKQVSENELRRRLKENQNLIDVVVPHLEWMSRTYGNIPNAVYLLDRDGVLLYSGGNDQRVLDELRLLPGYDWSQERAGNNGAGTALALDAPVVVAGDEHFVKEHKGFTCLGVPIHGLNREVVGSIDFSTHNAHGNAERLAVLIHLAHTIEKELAFRQRERQIENLKIISRMSSLHGARAVQSTGLVKRPSLPALKEKPFSGMPGSCWSVSSFCRPLR